MIITHCKPYGIVRGMLKKRNKICVVACNSCARACETGGRKKMEEVSERLAKDGFDIVEKELIPMACNIDLAKKPEYVADTLLILACDAGFITFQMLFPSKTIIPANETVGFGARDGQGNLFLLKRF